MEIGNAVLKGIRPKIDDYVPLSYKNLIERCWDQDPKKRPSFDQIVEELKTDEDFITEFVEQEDFFDYVEYIENSKTDFDSTKNIIQIDKFVHRQTVTFKKISISQLKTSQKEIKDASERARNFKMEANNGNTIAMYNYAVILIKGEGIPVDKIEAARYFKMAADNGHVISMSMYADMQSRGDGVPVNKIEAAHYYN